MPWHFAVIFLAYVVSVSATEDSQKAPEHVGRELRKAFLTMPSERAGIERSSEFPRVWGVVMDWPIGQEIATLVALADGSASVYTTGTFGIIGGIGHKDVRTAAKALVKKADEYYDVSSPNSDLSYPGLDHVRFYFRTFGGTRVVEVPLVTVMDERGRHSDLFGLAQNVIGQLRMASEQK